jgi:pimeloyl-ACP methyl ester carboxylesterase
LDSTGDIETVRALLGHTKIESTARYLRIAKRSVAYNYFDHLRYVEGFIRALKLTNITLVLQDWGGAFGFDYALRHRDNVGADFR